MKVFTARRGFTLLLKLIASPFMLAVFALQEAFPRLKDKWNPSPINVFVIGSFTASVIGDVHGTVMACKRTPDKSDNKTEVCLPDYQVCGCKKEYAFRIDRPEKLKRPSDNTLRSIVARFEEHGLKVHSITIPIGTNGIVYFPPKM